MLDPFTTPWCVRSSLIKWACGHSAPCSPMMPAPRCHRLAQGIMCDSRICIFNRIDAEDWLPSGLTYWDLQQSQSIFSWPVQRSVRSRNLEPDDSKWMKLTVAVHNTDICPSNSRPSPTIPTVHSAHELSYRGSYFVAASWPPASLQCLTASQKSVSQILPYCGYGITFSYYVPGILVPGLKGGIL